MNHAHDVERTPQPKALTGIAGFDEITNGGLPRGRTTLLVGGPGSGKTIFGLQFLAHGARAGDEPGVFVAFEETSARILSNARPLTEAPSAAAALAVISPVSSLARSHSCSR